MEEAIKLANDTIYGLAKCLYKQVCHALPAKPMCVRPTILCAGRTQEQQTVLCLLWTAYACA